MRPASFVHVTMAWSLNVEKPMSHRVACLGAAVTLTLVQLLTLVSFTRASFEGACTSNDDCTQRTRGTWCRVQKGRCASCIFGDACGANGSSAAWIASLPSPDSPMQQALFDGNFIKDEYETMCEACMDSRGKYTTSNEVEYNHVSFMKWRDWMSLALVSLIIAIFLARELVSIKRCEALLRHGGKRGAGAGWRAMLWFVCALRQFAILLQLGASVVVLIYAHGGDIFSVCVNAVATLFLLELDEALFFHGLPERARAWVEEHGALLVSEREARVLDWSRVAYVVAFAVGIPASCATRLAYPADGWQDWVSHTLYPMMGLTCVASFVAEPAALGGGAGAMCERFGCLLLRFLSAMVTLYLLLSFSGRL